MRLLTKLYMLLGAALARRGEWANAAAALAAESVDLRRDSNAQRLLAKACISAVMREKL